MTEGFKQQLLLAEMRVNVSRKKVWGWGENDLHLGKMCQWALIRTD